MIAVSPGEERAEGVLDFFEKTPLGQTARMRWVGESPFAPFVVEGDIVELLIGAPVRQGHIAFVYAACLKDEDEPDRPHGWTLARVFNVAGEFHFVLDETLNAVKEEERNWWRGQQGQMCWPVHAAPVVRVIRAGKPVEFLEEIFRRYDAARDVVDDLEYHRPSAKAKISEARKIAARLARNYMRTRRRRDALRKSQPKPMAWGGGL